MIKSSKSFLKSIVVSFIPFLLVTIIAVFFLNRTFYMLTDRNQKIVHAQTKNVLHDLEVELAISQQVANQMCIDSALSREKLLEYGRLTVAAIERMNIYDYRMKLNPVVFLTYDSKSLATKLGTTSLDVFSSTTLNLTQDSIEHWNEALQSTEAVSDTLLECRNGKRYLLLVYYYPESNHIQEKRIGIVFDESEMKSLFQETILSMNGTAILMWKDQIVTFVDGINEPAFQEDELLKASELPKGEKNRTILIDEADFYNLKLIVALNNSVLASELLSEEITMVIVGVTVFFCLSLIIWCYSKHRYRILNEVKQLAITGWPDFPDATNSDEYEIIKAVLENNFRELKSKTDNLESLQNKSKRQMSWLLLCAPTPEDVDVAQLLESYGISGDGDYYCAMEFLLPTRIHDIDEALNKIPEVFLHCVIHENSTYSLVIALSLRDRDSNRKKRRQIASDILDCIAAKNIPCLAVSCGLIYEQPSQLFFSRNESQTVLQARNHPMLKKETILFFDEMLRIPKNFSNEEEALLDQFSESIRKEDATSASKIMNQLLAKGQNEVQQIYVRYKLVHSMIVAMQETDISPNQPEEIMKFVFLNNDEFECKMAELLSQFYIYIEKEISDQQILEYINSNYNNSEISIVNVADHFGISERSVSRIIKKSINVTYKQYLNQLRMNQACKLLVESNMDIRLIIKEVGYYDTSSFNRLFKRTFEMTPMEYRNCNGYSGVPSD